MKNAMKFLKTCETSLWPESFCDENRLSQVVATTSWGTTESFRMEIRDYNPKRREALGATFVGTSGEPVQVKKVDSMIGANKAWEIFPQYGDTLIVAKWNWSRTTAREEFRIRLLQFRRFDQERGEAVFSIVDKYDYRDLNDFSSYDAEPWLQNLPPDVRSATRRTIRQLMRSDTVRVARADRHKLLRHIF